MKLARITPQNDAAQEAPISQDLARKDRDDGGVSSESAPALLDEKCFAVYKFILQAEQTPVARSQALRSSTAGIPMSGKRQIRAAIQRANAQDTENVWKAARRMACNLTGCMPDTEWMRIPLWRRSFKTLEGMYGSGVLSFFILLKSLFILNILLTLLAVVFVIAPQAANWSQQSAMLTGLQASADTNISGICSEAYAKNLSATIASSTLQTKVLDVIQGTGMLENSIIFIGNYFPTKFAYGVITSYNMPVAYVIVLGVAFFLSLMYMLQKTGSEFKAVLMQRATSTTAWNAKYTALVLSGWDHSLCDAESADLARRILGNSFIAELDLHQMKLRQEMGGRKRAFLRRVKVIVVNLIVLGCLGGSGYLIYVVQTLSVNYTSSSASASQSGSLVYFFYQYMPSVVISLLSGILPVVFYLLVELEEYVPDTALAVTLVRCIGLRLASIAMLVASIYATIMCQSKDLCGIGRGSCTAVSCWESYVGQAFYRLEITFLGTQLVACFLVELPRSLIGRKCSCKFASLIGPPEFDIPDSVLQVIYCQIIVWLGMTFCPILPAMNAVSLCVLFYLRKFSCLHCYQPPKRPLKSSIATILFMGTLLVAYFLCIIPIGYLIVALPTSKSCSPYRTGPHFYNAISSLVASFASDGRTLVDYMGSAAFLFLVVVSLLILIHYYRTLAAAREEIASQRLKQLTEQEKLKFSRSSGIIEALEARGSRAV